MYLKVRKWDSMKVFSSTLWLSLFLLKLFSFFSLRTLQTLLSSNIYALCGSARGLGKKHKPPCLSSRPSRSIYSYAWAVKNDTPNISLSLSQAHGCQIQLAYYERFPSWLKVATTFMLTLSEHHIGPEGKIIRNALPSTTLNSPDDG